MRATSVSVITPGRSSATSFTRHTSFGTSPPSSREPGPLPDPISTHDFECSQCELVSISRSSFYYQPAGETAENLGLMRLIDAQFLETPWYGSRQMARHLRRDGHEVGRKRVRRLMAVMGLVPIYQRPRTTVPNPEHRIWLYLLRGMVIDRPNQVWCTDLTYIPMRVAFSTWSR